MNGCDCTCHAMSSAFARCSGEYADGGCGHLHRAAETSTPEIDPVPEEHRCHRSQRCSDAEKVEVKKGEYERKGARIMAAHGLCMICQRVVTEAITELPRDYVELHLALERGSAGIQEVVAATKDLPAALRVNIAALAAELVRVATMWAEPVADRLGIDWDTQDMDRHARPGHALQRAVGILSKGFSVLLAIRDHEVQAWADNGWYHTHEPVDGLDGALSLLRLHEITRAALGLTRLTHQLPAPCPSCDHLALVRHDGQEDVYCQHCRRRWTYQDYERLVLVLTSDVRARTG